MTDQTDAWRIRALAAERIIAEPSKENLDRYRATVEALSPYWNA